jgi:uncharacterized membrane protein
MEKHYNIRYNTKSTDDSNRWRLICDGKEILVSNIVITSKTNTTSVFVEELDEYKYHISCVGVLQIVDNVAIITSSREKNILKRHILKTISYRALATTTTIGTAIYFGASLEVSALLGMGELLIKPFLYFIHERFWYKVKK